MTVIGHCTTCGDFTSIDAHTRLCEVCDEEADRVTDVLWGEDDALSAIGRHLLPKGGDHHAP